MNEIAPFYPDFVPNQVLTNTQLNNLRNYLDQQDHLTRVRLTGTGIVCGLTWSLDIKGQHLTIYEGYGLTSYDNFGIPDGGYLIEMDHKKYAYYRKYTAPDIDDEDNPRYEPWQRPGDLNGQIDIIELLEAPEGATPLDDKITTDRVLVLYLEKKGVDLNSCLVTECDNKGLNINLNVRALLIKKEDLKEIPACTQPTLMAVPRLHTVVALDKVEKVSDINDGYKEIILKLLDPLINNIAKNGNICAGFLDIDQKVFDKLNSLKTIIDFAVTKNLINQYHYDYIKDIVHAYNEFVTAACELLIDCCPLADFDRHLMLGAIDHSGRYRNEFIPSAVRNVMQGDLERIRGLLMRIFEIIDSFSLTDAKQVLLTPSHTELHPLGKRAVPYYFKPTTALENYWQPKLCCTTDTLWSYHLRSILKSAG